VLRDAFSLSSCRISTDDYANGQAQSLYNIVMNLFFFFFFLSVGRSIVVVLLVFFSFLSAPVIDRFLVLNIKAKDVTTVKDKKKTNQNKMSWTGVYGDLIRKGKVSSSSFDKYFDFNWQTRRKGCWWRGKVIWRVLVSSSFINKRKTNQFVWSFSFTYFFFFNVLVR